jgi:hypothetical protein
MPRPGRGREPVRQAVNGFLALFSVRIGKLVLPAGVDMCLPGDNVTLNVKLPAETPIAMDEGLRFAIREGGKTVGSGVVHFPHKPMREKRLAEASRISLPHFSAFLPHFSKPREGGMMDTGPFAKELEEVRQKIVLHRKHVEALVPGAPLQSDD